VNEEVGRVGQNAASLWGIFVFLKIVLRRLRKSEIVAESLGCSAWAELSASGVAAMANAGDEKLFGYMSDVFVFTFLSITAEVFTA
jgi:hypothetical protein